METKKQLTFGDVENNTPFIIDGQCLYKMGAYGFGVDINGTVARTFKDSDFISINKHVYIGFAEMNHPCTECGLETRNSIHYYNAGTVCDTLEGACACGAWHKQQ